MLVVTASVPAQTPARTIVRACNHFKHRVEVKRQGDDAVVEFPGSPCHFHAAEGRIEIRLEAADADALERLKEVVARHLKQVAVPEELVVDWVAA